MTSIARLHGKIPLRFATPPFNLSLGIILPVLYLLDFMIILLPERTLLTDRPTLAIGMLVLPVPDA